MDDLTLYTSLNHEGYVAVGNYETEYGIVHIHCHLVLVYCYDFEIDDDNSGYNGVEYHD